METALSPGPPGAGEVLPLAASLAADVALVGGKAANLGELLRAGLPVPAGFVVTTAAYAAAAARSGLAELLSDPAGLPPPSALRAAILAADVPAPTRDAITAAYLGLGAGLPVAVRSSATAEDLPGAAFAGQQDSFLNVVGEGEVVAAVRRCWASLWTDRAVAYRRDRAISPGEVAIAVVVQAMVASDLAGVMFTADPVGGARDRVIVDAGAGLGEAVVAGLVTPDHYRLDPRGRVLDWTPGRGEVVIRATPGGGTRQEAGPAAGRGGAIAPPGRLGRARWPWQGVPLEGALLDRGTLATLAAHARTIAGHFGRPQDIEWAIAGGRVWILQARPMTALPPPSVPLGRIQRLQASILTEYVPLRPYPMDVTTALARGAARMMNDIGEHYGIAGAFENFLREEDGVVVALLPPSPRPTLRLLATPWRLLCKARRFPVSEWTGDPRQGAFLAEVEALNALDLARMAWPDLLGVPDRALAAERTCRDLRIDFLPGCALALLRLVLVLRLLGRPALLGDLLGGAPTRTHASNRALAALASEAGTDPALRALVTGRDPAAALAALATEARFAGFRTRLDAFLAEFGGRETASLLLVSTPTLAESPAIVLGMVGALVADPRPGGEAVSRSATALGEVLGHPRLRHRPRARARLRRWVAAAQEAVAFREDTHFQFTATLPALRRSILEIGRRLAAAGLLGGAEDVFHLRWEEVGAIADPEAIPAGQAAALRARVRQRAARRAELSGVPLIDLARVFPPAPAADALVTGTPAGPGTATGPARIIRGVEDFDRLRPGDVLVCPYTNPAWTPLFGRAAAVVVDTGASASHAAIVAREYGLPAVMGTGTGTAVIPEGETVTVDGTRGQVIRAVGVPRPPA